MSDNFMNPWNKTKMAQMHIRDAGVIRRSEEEYADYQKRRKKTGLNTPLFPTFASQRRAALKDTGK